MTKQEAQERLSVLVGYFERNSRHIKANFTEEDTKQKLIQPFFSILGWDFTKDQDVRYERSGGKQSRVDYVFGNRHFYLEAKASNADSVDNVLQANFYAYNKSRFCVLTDFETFKLIKPIRPTKSKPQLATVETFDLTYRDYLSRFDQIWDTFSKEAVLINASLEDLLEEEKKRRKFFTIDEDFLTELEDWRKELALDIYLNNKKIVGADGQLLTEFTQRILDRIIFSKFLEDRGIEEKVLRDLIETKDIYPKMVLRFSAVGRAYNGLIYNPHTVDGLSVGDDVLNRILSRLYDTPHHQSFYNFGHIPIEILGSIYERFLGKVLKIRPENHRRLVQVVEKPEVARAKGVYYTPDFIVDYVVKSTVAKIFNKRRALEKVSNIKIVDISCGSGSFLVGAYSYLLSWYLNYYIKHPRKALSDGALLDGKLVKRIRKTILVRHIYGVDIDPQACEVAQMSLYLKMLEDCPDIQHEIKLSDLILPDMKNNIRCGNSLIEPEYFLDRLFTDPEEMKQLSAFDWRKYFPEGFDCVIGNPPYIDSETMTKEYPLLRRAIQDTYLMTKGNWDIYIAFFERGLGLLKSGGFLSFITPDKWISKPFGDKLRIDTINSIYSIFNAGRAVFKRAKVDAIVTTFSKQYQDSIKLYAYEGTEITLKRTIKKASLNPPYAYDGLFSGFIDLFKKMEARSGRLSDLGVCENACATSDCYKLKSYIEEKSSSIRKGDSLKIINTGTIGKYVSKWSQERMVYLGNRYLKPVVQRERFLREFPNSYGQKSIKPKLIMKGLNLLDACLDINGDIIPGKATLIIPSDNPETLKLLLAIINSNLLFLYLKEKYPASSYNQGTTFTKKMINDIPIPQITESIKKEIISLVDKVLQMRQQRIDADTEVFERAINAHIYKIYGLTDDEVKTVETWVAER
ncbi:MAG: DNA methyltransferase [Acidobacteriota bacterium]